MDVFILLHLTNENKSRLMGLFKSNQELSLTSSSHSCFIYKPKCTWGCPGTTRHLKAKLLPKDFLLFVGEITLQNQLCPERKCRGKYHQVILALEPEVFSVSAMGLEASIAFVDYSGLLFPPLP